MVGLYETARRHLHPRRCARTLQQRNSTLDGDWCGRITLSLETACASEPLEITLGAASCLRIRPMPHLGRQPQPPDTDRLAVRGRSPSWAQRRPTEVCPTCGINDLEPTWDRLQPVKDFHHGLLAMAELVCGLESVARCPQVIERRGGTGGSACHLPRSASLGGRRHGWSCLEISHH